MHRLTPSVLAYSGLAVASDAWNLVSTVALDCLDRIR